MVQSGISGAQKIDWDTEASILEKIIEYETVHSIANWNDFKKVGYMKGYNVFNLSQIENLPAEYYKHIELENLSDFEKNENAENLINNTGAEIVYLPQNRAFYNHIEDKIYYL